MTITITAFERSPDGGKGLVRDARVRWAPEEVGQPHAERLPLVEDRVRERLGPLSGRLGDADWLDGPFSAGDLMMASVLPRVKPSGILNGYPNLAAYVARGEARPAYQRAFAAQLAVYTGTPPTG